MAFGNGSAARVNPRQASWSVFIAPFETTPSLCFGFKRAALEGTFGEAPSAEQEAELLPRLDPEKVGRSWLVKVWLATIGAGLAKLHLRVFDPMFIKQGRLARLRGAK